MTASMWVLVWACIAAFFGVMRPAEGAVYTFTNIADNTGTLDLRSACPTINDEGTVAFTATDLVIGETGVYVVRNGFISLIVDTTGDFLDIDVCAFISNSGTVLFRPDIDDITPGLFIARDGSITPVPTQPAEPQTGEASINSNDTVAFSGSELGEGVGFTLLWMARVRDYN